MSPSQHAPRCLPCQPTVNTHPERATHGEKSFLSAQTMGSQREGTLPHIHLFQHLA